MASEKPTTNETAKQRSLRVPLGHHSQRNSLGNWKSTAAVLALVAATAYVIWLLMPTTAARQHLSPGPVTVSHAMWDNDCAQCHLLFRPQRSDAVDFLSLVGNAAQVQNEACTRCHPGPPHHHNVKDAGLQSCSTCHIDHRGREANITRSTDVNCTVCHKDIQAHRSGPGISPPIENVTAFGPPVPGGVSPHPEFRSLQSDPGTIKFNHWLHMQPGISLPNARKQLRWEDLPESDRPKYAPFKNDEGLVQLACAACHRLNADGGPTIADTMSPISFENHCRACHPLDAKVAGGEASHVPVPHGLSVARVTALVEGLLAESERKPLAKAEPTPDESGASPLIPGRTLGNNLAQKIAADALARRGTVLQAIHVKCQQCHEVEAGAASETTIAALPEVKPSSVPSAWLKHGRFAHAAHEHLQCRACHAQAYAFEQRNQPQMILPGNEKLPPGYTAANDWDQVMIANLENCVTCHAPAANGAGGARHDCAECHRYHHASETVAPPKVASERSHDESPPLSGIASEFRLSSFAFRPRPLDLKLVSQRSELRSPASALVGATSCAASGCHGDTRPNATASANAFHTWLNSDPHARAYDVLWTFRGREMTRLLSLGKGDEKSANSEQQHRQVLAERCLGCHATPPNHKGATGDSDYSLGVHCESCHGPAGGWLFEHQLDPKRQTAAANRGSGQVDTKDLNQRAGVCMNCHVGPSFATGSPQTVDHDLIAAGHPRLNFEFHSYFESLPAHWDRKKDEKNAPPGEFHFRAWHAGHDKQTEQFDALIKHFAENANSGRIDFSVADCFACHHALANDASRQQTAHGRDLLAPLEPVAFPSLPGSTAAAASATPSSQRLETALALIKSGEATNKTSWDHSLRIYLAVRAVTADLTTSPASGTSGALPKLKAAMNAFHRYLAQDCFELARPVTPYDSPTRFTGAAARRHHNAVASALLELQSEVKTTEKNAATP